MVSRWFDLSRCLAAATTKSSSPGWSDPCSALLVERKCCLFITPQIIKEWKGRSAEEPQIVVSVGPRAGAYAASGDTGTGHSQSAVSTILVGNFGTVHPDPCAAVEFPQIAELPREKAGLVVVDRGVTIPSK